MSHGEGTERGAATPGESGIVRGGESHWAGEPVRVWESRWQVPLFEAHGRLRSTNDRLLDLARAGAPAFTVVVAEEQTGGRGRGGRPWYAPAGLGLWISVLLPGERRGRPPLTPLVVGVAASRAVETLVPELEPKLKWPNDVLVGGRKVSGILCEGGAGAGTVAGVGINVHGPRRNLPSALREGTTTLEEEAGEDVPRPELASAFLGCLRNLLDPPPVRIEEGVWRDLRRRDALRGRPLETETGVRGWGAGIARDGALLVRTAEGDEHRVLAGGVEVLSTGDAATGSGSERG